MVVTDDGSLTVGGVYLCIQEQTAKSIEDEAFVPDTDHVIIKHSLVGALRFF